MKCFLIEIQKPHNFRKTTLEEDNSWIVPRTPRTMVIGIGIDILLNA
jgi:hypothetical protein